MTAAFDMLKDDYPDFTIRNRTNTAKDITLLNGETVQVGPNGLAKIPSAQILQLPDFRSFEMVTPSYSELMDYDMIGKREDTAPNPSTSDTPSTPNVNAE